VKAIEVAVHGGPEVLAVVQRPRPVPGPSEVLVRNEYIGVNYVDLQHRAGSPYPVSLPLVPGTEAAGTVVEVGAEVGDLHPGQRVVHVGHLAGVYAELTAVPAGYVVGVPDGIGLDTAAAVALQGTTAHVLTRVATRVGADDVVVVHAAAGGTGSAVTALAAAAGARVVGVVSTPAKRHYALAAGASTVVTGSGEALAAALREATGDRGASHVFDAGGKATLDVSLGALGDFGTLVLYGQTSGSGGMLDTSRLSGLSRPGDAASLTVTWVAAGHYLREAADRARATRAVFDDVASGVLRPQVVARFPLERAADAHRMLQDRATVGKILLAATGEPP
jgi:NADPH:quinone reductase